MSSYQSVIPDEKLTDLTTLTLTIPPIQGVYQKIRFAWFAACEILKRAHELNRYGHSQPPLLIEALAKTYQTTPSNVAVTTGGSDEIIRALINLKARRKTIVRPQYGFSMYKVFAERNDVKIVESPLSPANAFQPDPSNLAAILEKDSNVALVFQTSPSTPFGHLIDTNRIEEEIKLCQKKGILYCLDQVYARSAGDLTRYKNLQEKYENVVLIDSLSKNHGCAGERIGFAIAHKDVIDDLKKNSLGPYPMPMFSEIVARYMLTPAMQKRLEKITQQITEQRKDLVQHFTKLAGFVVHEPDAKGLPLTIQVKDAQATVEQFRQAGFRVKAIEIEGKPCVRLTAGDKKMTRKIKDAFPLVA